MNKSHPDQTKGKLTIVPTPIGNLGDISFRAVEVLRAADIVLTEDTRRANLLFEHYDIPTKRVSYYASIEAQRVYQVLEWLKAGRNVALISDAGMPGISDPGYRLLKAVIAEGLTLEVLPGPTALEPALLYSGLPFDRFVFEGFLPTKKHRQRRLALLAAESRTMVIYEAPHRLVKTLNDLAAALGSQRRAVVCREMTKLFEEIRRSTLGELALLYASQPPKGEIVLIVEGKPNDDK